MLEAHVVACNIYVEHHTATVNVETGQLLTLSPTPAPAPPLDWEAWTPPKGANHWDIWSRYNPYPPWVSKVPSLILISSEFTKVPESIQGWGYAPEKDLYDSESGNLLQNFSASAVRAAAMSRISPSK